VTSPLSPGGSGKYDRCMEFDSPETSSSPVTRPALLRAPVARTLASSIKSSVEEGSSQQHYRTGVGEAPEVYTLPDFCVSENLLLLDVILLSQSAKMRFDSVKPKFMIMTSGTKVP
jgi:hypothetical protein